jgi:hypothetical protein
MEVVQGPHWGCSAKEKKRSMSLVGKFLFAQLVKNYPPLMKPGVSLPRSQQNTMCSRRNHKLTAYLLKMNFNTVRFEVPTAEIMNSYMSSGI